MLFSELYGAYYNTVAAILTRATKENLSKKAISAIITENAYADSVLQILPALTDEKWQLLRRDGSTPIKRPPTMPLTTLQLRWLKSVSLDPRIKLFCDSVEGLDEIEPLFTPEDIRVYDSYADGDPYDSEEYIAIFRTILHAAAHKVKLYVRFISMGGQMRVKTVSPSYIEYSEKDDKFRLICHTNSQKLTINIATIIGCKPTYEQVSSVRNNISPINKSVTLELINEHNVLERALLHFAHFKKEAERLSKKTYRLTLWYDPADETEIVIRILSFGPRAIVTEPEDFRNLIKERLKSQIDLLK